METIRLESYARGVARLTLARAEKHNALSARMIAELTQAAAAIAADAGIRVVVLAGAGAIWPGCANRWARRQTGAGRRRRSSR